MKMNKDEALTHPEESTEIDVSVKIIAVVKEMLLF